MSRTKDQTYLNNRQHAFNTSDTCWICGQYIDPNLKFPHRWSRSGHHVIPIERGGHNHGPIVNTHLRCNQLLGTKPAPLLHRHGRKW